VLVLDEPTNDLDLDDAGGFWKSSSSNGQARCLLVIADARFAWQTS